VVTDHAAQLAPARAPAPRKRGSPLRTNAAFTTANHAYLAARAARRAGAPRVAPTLRRLRWPIAWSSRGT
jgi:hypothetical protein